MVASQGTAGTINLNSHNQTIGSLASSGTIGTITNIGVLTIGGTATNPVNQSAAYGGTISGNGSITKNGGGTQTFSGSNAYTGGTTINAGAINVLNTTGAALGTGLVTVNNGATLGGMGITGTGLVTVNSGGQISPTVVGLSTSTLQLKGGLTLNGGSILGFNLGAINTGTNPLAAPTSDNVYVTGNLTLGTGTDVLSITPVGSGLAIGTYHLITATGTVPANLNGITFSISGPAADLYSVVDNTANKSLDLVVTVNPNPSLTWVGAPGNGQWDLNSANTPWTFTGASGSSPYVDGANLTFDNTPGMSSAINLAANVAPSSLTFNNNVAVNYTISGTGSITGTEGLTKKNVGTVTFSNTNAFTGTVALQGGSIIVGSTGSLADTSFNISSAGTLTVNGSLTALGLSINNAGTFNVAGSIPTTTSISGAGSVTFTSASQTLASLNGSGPLVLSGPTNLTVTGGGVYSGAVSGNGGVLSVTSSALSLSGTVSGSSLSASTGGTLNASGPISGGSLSAWTGGIVNASGPISGDSLSASTGGTLNASGPISGGASVSASGGTVSLSGSNTYTGGTSIAAGGLVQVNNNAALGSAAPLSMSGGTLDMNGYNNGGVGGPGGVVIGNLSATSGVITDNSAAGGSALQAVLAASTNSTFAGSLVKGASTAPALTIAGAGGTLNLTATNTVNGLWVNNGVLNISGSFASTGKTIIGSGVAGDNSMLNWSAVGGFNPNNFFGLGDWSPGTLNVTAGTLAVTNATSGLFIGNNFAGAVNVSGGLLSIDATPPTFNIGGINGAGGTDAGTGVVTISGGTLSIAGSGNITFGDNNALSGGTINLNGGLLQNGRSFVLGNTGSSGVFNFGGGTLQATANFNMTGLGPGAISAGGAVIDTQGNAVTIGQNLLSGAVAPAIDGGLTKVGSGTLTLSGTASTYNGGTIINAGNLAVTNSASLGAISGGVVINNGALEVATGFVDSRQITFNAPNAALQVDANQTYSNTTPFLVSTGTLTKTGAGTLLMPIPLPNVNLAANGGTIDLGGLSHTVGTVTFNGGTITDGNLTGTSYVFNGPGSVSANLLGNVPLIVNSGGNAALSGTNSIPTPTVNPGGALRLASPQAIGSVPLALTGGTISINTVSGTAGAGLFGQYYFPPGGVANVNNADPNMNTLLTLNNHLSLLTATTFERHLDRGPDDS